MMSNTISSAEPIVAVDVPVAVTASTESQITKDADVEPVQEIKFTDTLWREGCDLGCTHEKASDDFGDEDEGSKAFVDAIASVIRKYLKDVIRSIKSSTEFVVKRPIVAGDNTLFFDAVDNEHIEQLLVAASSKNLSTVYFGAGTDSIMSLEEQTGVSVGGAFDMDTSAARNYLDKSTRRIAKDIPVSLQREVRREIANGMANGSDVNVVANKLNDWGSGSWTTSRAKRIARTETRYAQEAGKMEGWTQSGVVAGKEFLVAPSACPVCRAVDSQVKGKLFPIGGKFFDKGDDVNYTDESGKKRKFKFNYTSMKGPPVHPNCRCTLIPVIKEDT